LFCRFVTLPSLLSKCLERVLGYRDEYETISPIDEFKFITEFLSEGLREVDTPIIGTNAHTRTYVTISYYSPATGLLTGK